MSTTDWRDELPGRVRVMQIIIGAMFFGCLTFLIIAAFLAAGQHRAVEQPMVTYIALAMAVMIIVPFIVVPRIIVAQGRKKMLRETSPGANKSAEQRKELEARRAGALVELYQTKTIVSGALLEGTIFFLTIAYMIEGSPLSVVPAIVLMLVLIAQMPTTGRVANWIQRQLRLIDEERSFG
ncbi:MAG: hypothetical protein ACWGMZ_08765 [Thermoguttaceae bacterium]